MWCTACKHYPRIRLSAHLTVAPSSDDDGTFPQSTPLTSSLSTSTGSSTVPSSTSTLSSGATTFHSSPGSSQRNKILLGVLIPLLIILAALSYVLYIRCRRTRTRRHQDQVDIASPFLAPLAEPGNITTVSIISKGGSAGDRTPNDSGLIDASPTDVPPPLPRKLHPPAVIGTALANDHTSLASYSAPSSVTHVNLSQQPLTAFPASTVGPPNEVVFAPLHQFPGQSSHPEQGLGAQLMQPIVFAPISMQQFSGSRGYPLLTAWPQATGERNDDHAPPSYTSDAGLP